MSGIYCSSCGTRNPEGSRFCSSCGSAITIPVGAESSGATVASPETTGQATTGMPPFTASAEPVYSSAPVGTATAEPGYSSAPIGAATAEPVGAATQPVFSNAPVGTATAGPSYAVAPATQPAAQPVSQPPAVRTEQPATPATTTKRQTARKSSSSSFSQSELWTWLKKDDRRQLFFRDGQEPLDEADYMALVSEKLAQNEVPATIERRHIAWDRSTIAEEMYVVAPSTSAVDPLSCVLQFASVGEFSFVEEKTFLAPPALPPVPEKKVPVPANKYAGLATVAFGAIVIGVIALLLGSAIRLGPALGIVLILVGLGLFYLQSIGNAPVEAARKHNENVNRQEAAWEKAWDKWETDVFIHSFQESTHGQVTRIYQAVFESIKQVNAELFQGAESVEEREEAKMGELESQIARRKKSYR